MAVNPIVTLLAQPAIHKRSLEVDTGLILHYRHDLPGELETSEEFSHHLLTFFLTSNSRQVTRFIEHGEYDGQMLQEDFYLCPAGMTGRTSWRSSDETLHVAIDPGLLQQVALETDYPLGDRMELLPVLRRRDRAIENLMRLFYSEILQIDSAQKLYLESLSNLLCIHLLRKYCNVDLPVREVDEGLAPYKLKQVLDYIHTHLDGDLSLTLIAKQIGISRSYFANQFRQSMNMPPHQYVTQKRIEKAKQLLQARTRSISQIALDCGFSNQSHLTRVFRKHIGIPPKAYQDSVLS